MMERQRETEAGVFDGERVTTSKVAALSAL